MLSKNENLYKAKGAKAIEFYTVFQDIASECNIYTDKFQDKVVYCNCDDPFLLLKELVSAGKDIMAVLCNNIFTHMNINFVCALGGVA